MQAAEGTTEKSKQHEDRRSSQEKAEKPPDKTQELKSYETETQEIRPDHPVSKMVIDAQKKQYNKQDIKKEKSKGYQHKCGLPTYAIISNFQHTP